MPSPPGQRSTHRSLWVVVHSLLIWGVTTLAVLQFGYPEALRAAVALLFMCYPFVLYLRWHDTDAYLGRTYCYAIAIAIAFCGVALFAGNALLLGMALGSSSWR